MLNQIIRNAVVACCLLFIGSTVSAQIVVDSARLRGNFAIDAGMLCASLGGYLKNFSGSDRPAIWLVFKDGNNFELLSTTPLEGETSSWVEKNEVVAVPRNTRFVEFHVAGTRFAGTDNDSYIDDLNLQVGELSVAVLGDANDDCVLNNLDIAAFVLALLNRTAYELMYPDVTPDIRLDMNNDGALNNLDLSGFVAALLG